MDTHDGTAQDSTSTMKTPEMRRVNQVFSRKLKTLGSLEEVSILVINFGDPISSAANVSGEALALFNALTCFFPTETLAELKKHLPDAKS
ncbi:MAG: hypothetical protein HY506_01450 [Candidatus Yanofskybacteria bacterium]|nr:hypothetical protein [Candidatus Yanofskybacteria bacterium]